MLLYDKNLQLIGITEDSLKFLGFSSFEIFISNFNDISELFVDKKGFLNSNKENFDKFLQNSSVNSKNAILRVGNSNFIEISLNKIRFFSKNSLGYTFLDLNYIKEINKDIYSANFIPTIRKNLSFNEKYKMPNVFEIEYKKTIENLNAQNIEKEIFKKEKISDSKNGNFDNAWFDKTLKKLEVNSDDLKFFLKEFLKGQVELEEKLQEALLLNDKSAIKSVISTLRDPASNLNLDPVLFYLDKFEKAKTSEISELFRNYKNVLREIEKYTKGEQRKLV